MSVDRILYLGPYAVCKLGAPRTVKRPYRACSNQSCFQRAHRDTDAAPLQKFCPDCGSRVVDAFYEAQEPAVDSADLRESIRSVLVVPCGSTILEEMRRYNEHWWLLNNGRVGIREDVDCEDCILQRVSPDVCLREIVEFREAYDAELKKLVEAYVSVDVVWGLVYWSY